MNYDDFKSAYYNLMEIGKKANKNIQKDIYMMIENLIAEYPRYYEGMLYEGMVYEFNIFNDVHFIKQMEQASNLWKGSD